jgi:hypothetical protein
MLVLAETILQLTVRRAQTGTHSESWHEKPASQSNLALAVRE